MTKFVVYSKRPKYLWLNESERATLLNQACYCLEENRCDDAIVFLNTTLYYNKKDAEALVYRADAYRMLLKSREAWKDLNNAMLFIKEKHKNLNLNVPGYVRVAFYLRGALLHLNRKYDEALADLNICLIGIRTPLEIELQARERLAKIYLMWGDLINAEKQLTELQKKYKNRNLKNSAAYYYALRAEYHLFYQSYEKMSEFLKACFDLRPSSEIRAYALTIKSVIYSEKQHVNEAKKCLIEAIELNPENTYAFYYLGRLNVRLQEYKEAIYNLTELLKLEPDSSRTDWGLYFRGTAYFYSGDYDSAQQDLSEILESTNLSEKERLNTKILYENAQQQILKKELENKEIPVVPRSTPENKYEAVPTESSLSSSSSSHSSSSTTSIISYTNSTGFSVIPSSSAASTITPAISSSSSSSAGIMADSILDDLPLEGSIDYYLGLALVSSGSNLKLLAERLCMLARSHPEQNREQFNKTTRPEFKEYNQDKVDLLLALNLSEQKSPARKFTIDSESECSFDDEAIPPSKYGSDDRFPVNVISDGFLSTMGHYSSNSSSSKSSLRPALMPSTSSLGDFAFSSLSAGPQFFTPSSHTSVSLPALSSSQASYAVSLTSSIEQLKERGEILNNQINIFLGKTSSSNNLGAGESKAVQEKLDQALKTLDEVQEMITKNKLTLSEVTGISPSSSISFR